MDLEVVWTKFAENKLIDIFEYYKKKASLKVAKRITVKIVNQTINLKKNNQRLEQLKNC